MRRQIAMLVSGLVLVASCTTGQEVDSIALTSELSEIAADANTTLFRLFSTLDQPYEDVDLLYQRITDLGLPTAFAIGIDKAKRVTPPPGSEPELERFVSFLSDLLFASEDLDLAIATDDPVAAAIAIVSMDVAAGGIAVSLPAESCRPLTPYLARDLCDPGTLAGYEDSLSFELRRFAASFRPALRVPPAFGEAVRARTIASLRDDGNAVLAAAGERLGSLEPDATHDPIHQIIVDYFVSALDTWAMVVAPPEALEPADYDVVTDRIESERVAARRQLVAAYPPLLSAQPDSKIAVAVASWFREPDEADSSQ